MSILLHGAPVAERLTLDLSRRSAALRHRGVIPTLAILRVGSSPGDLAYEKSAAARCARCGIEVRRLFWDSAAPLADAIRAVNADPSIHGCLLLRPLADRAAEAAAGQLLLPDKDVDGMTPESAAAVFTGQGRGFAPCTAEACMALLRHYGIAPCGRHAVVIGRSPVVGRPVSMLLLRENATVTVCHTKTPDTAVLTREADIIITAAGAVNSLTAAHVRPGQIVLDVSMNWNGTALCGDADFPAVSSIVDAITPVPGGVGAVTSAVLMAHTVRAAEYLTGEGGA